MPLVRAIKAEGADREKQRHAEPLPHQPPDPVVDRQVPDAIDVLEHHRGCRNAAKRVDRIDAPVKICLSHAAFPYVTNHTQRLR